MIKDTKLKQMREENQEEGVTVVVAKPCCKGDFWGGVSRRVG